MNATPRGYATKPIHKSLLAAIVILTLFLTLTQTASAQMPWAPDYQTAMRIARETDRLVLLHFWNDGCPPCAMMETEVFSRQDVAQAIGRDYVPVSIRSADAPSLIQQFGITGVPADVILNADGEFVAKSSGGVDAQTYMSRWATVAQRYRDWRTRQQSELETRPPNPTGSTGTRPPTPTEQPPALAQINEGMGATGQGPGTIAHPTAHPIATSAELPPYGNGAAAALVSRSAAPPEASPSALPHAMDGFCAVALNEQEQWIQGDPRWTTTYQGRSYVFSSPQAMQQFLVSPERFAPAASGIDIVLHSQQAGSVPGERRYGVWCDDQIFLFSNPDTLRAFQENPSYYIEYVRRIENAASGSSDRAAM